MQYAMSVSLMLLLYAFRRPMEGNGVTPIFRSFHQSCRFPPQAAESLEHFNMFFIYHSEPPTLSFLDLTDVSLMLLLNACVSRSVSPFGTWAVVTLRETLGYVDITCVISVSKSPLPFIVYYVFGG